MPGARRFKENGSIGKDSSSGVVQGSTRICLERRI